MPLTTAALHSAYHQGTGMAVRTLWNLGKTSVDEGRFGRLTCRIGKLLSNSLIEETRAGTKVSQYEEPPNHLHESRLQVPEPQVKRAS
jgi:hypothetical protein